MSVKSIADCSKGEHSEILSTFIKLPFVIKIFVLSISDGLTGFTEAWKSNIKLMCVYLVHHMLHIIKAHHFYTDFCLRL